MPFGVARWECGTCCAPRSRTMLGGLPTPVQVLEFLHDNSDEVELSTLVKFVNAVEWRRDRVETDVYDSRRRFSVAEVHKVFSGAGRSDFTVDCGVVGTVEEMREVGGPSSESVSGLAPDARTGSRWRQAGLTTHGISPTARAARGAMSLSGSRRRFRTSAPPRNGLSAESTSGREGAATSPRRSRSRTA